MKIQNFQMYEPKSWKGFSTENHLGSIFQKKPQKATNTMLRLLATNRGKNLENYLMQFPVKYFDTNDEFYWELIGSSRRNLPLVEARIDLSGTTVSSSTVSNVGANGARFFLVFAEDWFADGNVIVGEKPDLYPIRIVGPASIEGTDAVYECELMGNVKAGIPPEELLGGKKFSKEFSPVEHEMSREVGDIHFTSPFAMRGEFSSIRIKVEVPRTAMGRKLATKLPVVGKDGAQRTIDTWMHYVDFKLEEEFSDEKAKCIAYGKTNRDENGKYNNRGKSGFFIKQGSGIREQMEQSNTYIYSTFDLKLVEDVLYSISESKLGLKDRLFVMRTGERGAAQFHKAAQAIASGWNAFNYLGSTGAPAIIQKTTSELHSNALSFGYQFVEYRAPNGVVLRVEVDPMYDDRERNKVMHPNGGVAESYRYDIMYIGSTDEPNIQIAKVRGMEDIRGYQNGPFGNPFTGKTGNENASWDIDGSVIHKIATFGAIVYDPSRTVTLIPSLLY
jgi:hypothetical protein